MDHQSVSHGAHWKIMQAGFHSLTQRACPSMVFVDATDSGELCAEVQNNDAESHQRIFLGAQSRTSFVSIEDLAHVLETDRLSIFGSFKHFNPYLDIRCGHKSDGRQTIPNGPDM